MAKASKINLVLLAALTAIVSLCPSGALAGWGMNNWGQARPPDGNGYIAVSGGDLHSLALQRVCRYVIVGDVNDDCEVDFDDFALMGANWLIDCYIEPGNPACVAK